MIQPKLNSHKNIFQFQSEPCDAKKCNDHGKCTVNIDADAICECTRNYTGKYCQFLMRKSVLLTQIHTIDSIIFDFFVQKNNFCDCLYFDMF